jgi:VanZ family protein
MKKSKYKIIYLVLVLIWMLTVFMFSSQNGEQSQNTSGKVTQLIVEIITHNQNITASEKLELIENTDYYIRKFAHYSIYALGGILIYIYINTYNASNKKVILISILIGVIYAISDESHQHFTSGRCASVLDVVIDSFGIITGIILINIIKKAKKPLYN